MDRCDCSDWLETRTPLRAWRSPPACLARTPPGCPLTGQGGRSCRSSWIWPPILRDPRPMSGGTQGPFRPAHQRPPIASSDSNTTCRRAGAVRRPWMLCGADLEAGGTRPMGIGVK